MRLPSSDGRRIFVVRHESLLFAGFVAVYGTGNRGHPAGRICVGYPIPSSKLIRVHIELYSFLSKYPLIIINAYLLHSVCDISDFAVYQHCKR
jgi:hypothetical protein